MNQLPPSGWTVLAVGVRSPIVGMKRDRPTLWVLTPAGVEIPIPTDVPTVSELQRRGLPKRNDP